MEISVVIITWNSGSEISQCLDSLSEALKCYTAEIFIVDNGSTDNTLALIEAHAISASIIRNDRNRGVASARNQALNLVCGDYVWILDSDTAVNQEALDGMVNFLSSHSDVGIASTSLVSSNSEKQESCRPFPNVQNKAKSLIRKCLGNTNDKYYYKDDLEGIIPFFPDYVIGASQLIKHDTLKGVGLLDENIFYGPEDADFCFRAKKVGWKTVCLPQYSIFHFYKRISYQNPFSKVSIKHLLGVIYYIKKHS